MKVLIFGGTGFIGKRVVKTLLDKENRVIVFSHKRKISDKKNVEHFKGDILDKNSIKEALKLKPDVVINLVGIIKEIPKRGITFKTMHFDAASNLIDSIVEFNKNIPLVQISANGVEKGKDITDYFKYKYQAEEKVKSSGLRYAIIRPSIVIGEKEGIVKDLSIPLSLGFFPLPKIDVKFSPVKVELVAEKIVKVAEDLVNGSLESNVIKICGEEEMNFRGLIEYIAKIVGKKVIFVPAPLFLFKIAAFLGDRFNFIPLNTVTLKMLLQGNVCSNNTNYVRY
ncbi:NAD-dependent epimerase/dehydratase [Thermodesulfobium narugense DSM 14796]|uniref:NAD-dependent epimerase/dehydratase n=1 Tax=Thermodesulfobium narugense DSM 14796 TaxID=747365 RepID=M1E8F5_9BACT|nr:NAD(P)H-binding protein [Thermodesulfobium narugense]AEE14910.1 NAD-dependent epimerase/dehydratase [Thermodesulfobium narugense DSM 14796]